MPPKPLPIFGQYNVQQFLQFCPEDMANWTLIKNETSKKGYALYPLFGRRHLQLLKRNILQFDSEPRAIKKSLQYAYVFDGNKVYRYSTNFSRIVIQPTDYLKTTGNIYFTHIVTPSYTLAVFTDGQGMWVHNEKTNNTIKVDSAQLMANPTAIATFGNRIIVTGENTSEFRLSKINMGALVGDNVNPADCFKVNGAKVFAFEEENIVNFAVLHNTLYIFQESITSVWNNVPSFFGDTGGAIVQFPWKKNTTYNFDYGLSQPFALSVDFGRMVWLGKNKDGLNQIVATVGDQPKPISTEAIDILLERDAVADELSPFLDSSTFGFLYQYQNNIYFRLSAGKFYDFGSLDIEDTANSIEYSFKTDSWKRCIELNGERNRVQQHIYFSNRHLVTVKEDNTVYELSGQFFTNEVRNPAQSNPQAADAYIPQPFRYERVTPIISEEDLGEFLTDWVQIDFVWGDKTFNNTSRPFDNTVYIIDEEGNFLITEEGEYIIEEGSNYPVIGDKTYYNWFKPHIELYYSDDGGVTYTSADVREFSQLGVYNWRMRWYELGPSRNRVYKLICVSPAPIVVLGGLMQTRRASGGAA